MKPRSVITVLLISTTVACAPIGFTRTAAEEPAVPARADAPPPSRDGLLQHAVKSALRADPWLDGALIAVSSRDGEVTLAGVVVSPQQRSRAQQLTAATRGVRGVDNVLEVEPVR